VVEEGAVLKNCIVFTRSHIARGIKMNRVVCDKNCVIDKCKNVSGSKEQFIHIPQGAKI
jgi:ADP-glucose pyrophosphorylase